MTKKQEIKREKIRLNELARANVNKSLSNIYRIYIKRDNLGLRR